MMNGYQFLFFRTAFVCCLAICSTPSSAGFFNNTAYLSAVKADREGKYPAAREKFAKLARLDDDSVACASAFKMFDYTMEGKGGPRDVSQAKSYLERAAKCQDVSWAKLATYRLGLEHEVGFGGGLPVNRSEAHKWFKAAESLGDATAGKAIRRLEFFPEVYVTNNSDYFNGATGLAPIGWEAVRTRINSGELEAVRPALLWHAQRGNENAQFALGLLLFDELGEAALRQAGGWFYLAARAGHVDAQRQLALYLLEVSLAPQEEAFGWLSRASSQGDAEAENLLGMYSEKPRRETDTPDYERAARHYENAIAMGSAKAAANLGALYAIGRGVPRDDDRAVTLLKQAADAGVLAARNVLFARFNIVYGDKKVIAQASSVAPVTSVPVARRELTPVEIFRSNSKSVFIVAAGSRSSKGLSQGSAVAIGPNLVATNCHVTRGTEFAGIFIRGEAQIMRPRTSNLAADICTYNVNTSLPAVAQVRSYSTLEIGEKVYAIGSPKGLENTFSEGIISGLRIENGYRMVQTTVPITNGSSGGGLFDSQGRLIGITTKGFSGSGNLNFAVSADELPDR